MYDYLIVGTGLFGSVFAYEASKRGKKCLVIDRRNHIGGNVYTENFHGINVHKYGAHIFHTNNKEIWNYVNRFTEFNRYTNSPIANFKGDIYNLPFNMNTFNKLWGVTTPQQAKLEIEKQRKTAGIMDPKNLEEKAISLVGIDIYEKLIKGYTEKQWGRAAKELPAFIIERIPVRFTYDNNYFSDQFQGIPNSGYTEIICRLLENSEVQLGIDYFKQRNELEKISKRIVFTGMIDEYYDYRFGALEYRSLDFRSTVLDVDNFQGNAVVNYTDRETPFTRIIEHKHFEFGTQRKTIITKEFPKEWRLGDEPYYPINNLRNNRLYQRYRILAGREKNIVFGGRLANYKYYDMHQVIASALQAIKRELNP